MNCEIQKSRRRLAAAVLIVAEETGWHLELAPDGIDVEGPDRERTLPDMIRALAVEIGVLLCEREMFRCLGGPHDGEVVDGGLKPRQCFGRRVRRGWWAVYEMRLDLSAVFVGYATSRYKARHKELAEPAAIAKLFSRGDQTP